MKSLLLIAAAIGLGTVSPCSGAQLGSCEAVKRQIREEGADKVLERFWSNDQELFTKFVSHVAAGERCWLQLAESLRAVSDAGASEELEESFSKALIVHPERILPYLSAGSHTFSVRDVCSGVQVGVDETAAGYRLWLKQARAAVKSAQLPANLETTRNQCLAEISKQEHHAE